MGCHDDDGSLYRGSFAFLPNFAYRLLAERVQSSTVESSALSSLRAFVKWAEPLSAAKFVRTVSFLRPEEGPNQAHATWYKWPY